MFNTPGGCSNTQRPGSCVNQAGVELRHGCNVRIQPECHLFLLFSSLTCLKIIPFCVNVSTLAILEINLCRDCYLLIYPSPPQSSICKVNKISPYTNVPLHENSSYKNNLHTLTHFQQCHQETADIRHRMPTFVSHYFPRNISFFIHPKCFADLPKPHNNIYLPKPHSNIYPWFPDGNHPNGNHSSCLIDRSLSLSLLSCTQCACARKTKWNRLPLGEVNRVLSHLEEKFDTSPII